MSLSIGDYLDRPRIIWQSFQRWLYSVVPKGLFARSLMIVIIPMVLLQSVATYFFMERHWQLVTYQLSRALTQDVAALIDLHQTFHVAGEDQELHRIARVRMNLDARFLDPMPLPPPLPKPFFDLLDEVLSQQITNQIKKPFWLDTVGQSGLIEIRVNLPDKTLRIIARRSAAYASNSHIFLLWMLATAMLLTLIAIMFLRNQIRPILRLATAAQDFGKGRDGEFYPHGAREVRLAGYAFVNMKRRVERAMEQRTTMLNGVSHDLRTVLTRFRLSLALLAKGPDVVAMQGDVDEMQRMLEGYLAFARGDTQETAVPTDIRSLLESLKVDIERSGHAIRMDIVGEAIISVRPDAFRRCLANLISNAQRYGKTILVHVLRDARFLAIHIDDDGKGIPLEQRDEVFRPFYRIDEARNQDIGNSGLGLAIARDIAKSHGGDVILGDSPQGGLRATVRIPV